MDRAAYLGNRNLYNSSLAQVTLSVLLILITYFIKTSAKDPKLKRVWLMMMTLKLTVHVELVLDGGDRRYSQRLCKPKFWRSIW